MGGEEQLPLLVFENRGLQVNNSRVRLGFEFNSEVEFEFESEFEFKFKFKLIGRVLCSAFSEKVRDLCGFLYDTLDVNPSDIYSMCEKYENSRLFNSRDQYMYQ